MPFEKFVRVFASRGQCHRHGSIAAIHKGVAGRALTTQVVVINDVVRRNASPKDGVVGNTGIVRIIGRLRRDDYS